MSADLEIMKVAEIALGVNRRKWSNNRFYCRIKKNKIKIIKTQMKILVNTEEKGSKAQENIYQNIPMKMNKEQTMAKYSKT